MTGEITTVQTLTTEELAEMIGVSPQTVRRLRQRGRGPRYVVLSGGHVRYYRPSVEAWLRGEDGLDRPPKE